MNYVLALQELNTQANDPRVDPNGPGGGGGELFPHLHRLSIIVHSVFSVNYKLLVIFNYYKELYLNQLIGGIIMRRNLVYLNKKYIFGILFLLISAAFSTTIPLFVKDILDGYGYYNKHMIIGMFIVIILQSIFSSIGTYIVSTDADYQILKFREKVKKHILLLPAEFFDDNNSNSLTSRVLNDTGQLRAFISMTVPQFIHGIIILFFFYNYFILFRLETWTLNLNNLSCSSFYINSNR